MKIYTIGFVGKTAEQFFGLLQDNGIRRLLDIRLNNRSQLNGFTKMRDLEYFLRELCGIEYRHEQLLAPSKELFDRYKRHGGTWTRYQRDFNTLLKKRKVGLVFSKTCFDVPTVMLCSEATAECCHRRLVAEYFRNHWGGVEIVHL
jgi:uncharacterized protein (DUF488 family)